MKRLSINSFILSQLAIKATKMLYRYKNDKNALYHMMLSLYRFFYPNFEEISLYIYYKEKEVLQEEIRVSSIGVFNGRDIIPIYQLPEKIVRTSQIVYRKFGSGRDILISLVIEKNLIGMLELVCASNFYPPSNFCEDLKPFQEIFTQGIQYLVSRKKIIEVTDILRRISRINKKFISLIELPDMEKKLIRIINQELGFDRTMIYFLKEDSEDTVDLIAGVFNKSRIKRFKVSIKEINSLLNQRGNIPLLHIPIIFDGKKKGGLIVDNFLTLLPFSKEIESFFEELSSELSLLFENSYLFRSIKREAIFDHLTGLLRPNHFYEKLDAELSRLRRASIIMLDFDNFKDINDNYGHQTGDKVLEIAGKIIRKNLRATDLACRMGGDEFIIFLPETDEKKALKIAMRIIDHFKNHQLKLGSLTLQLSLSAGISVFPDDGVDRKTLLAASDKALYLSKEKGKSQASIARELPSLS